ncbi:MAG TPA: protoporphyrinogen oxidase HemJ [Stellaceae bacterium]|nr:protoporphyrinogen oxidase HemJ [Stellaceae bacterium]
MTGWLVGAYPWIKALHVLAVIAWMAGLLYLPRLFVYHATVRTGSEASETFKTMERRLERAIMTPAMIATWLFGLILAGTPGLVDWRMEWLPVKLGFVAALTLFHFWMRRCRLFFAADRNRHSARFYRIINELPTLALIAIVILVVVKPF